VKRFSGAALAGLLVLGAVAIGGALYVVNEAEQVVITMFGEPIGDPVAAPGLHWKLPLLHDVHRFDKRFLEWDGAANQLTTRDKRFIFVDTFARWRITDPLLYFQRLQNERGAQSRLDDILDGETRNAIANHDLVEVVRSSNREPEEDETVVDAAQTFEAIEIGREKIRGEILARAQQRTSDLGIEILDVQFKRINYVEDVQRKVFDRMVAERRRIADRYRSEGEGEAARIRGEMERELKRIQSEAFREAEEIRGDADASATQVYAGAYDQSEDSRAFYQFLKTMQTLADTADEQTVLVLSTDGDLYRFLQRPQ
jgi:membrane protease subunit HflC